MLWRKYPKTSLRMMHHSQTLSKNQLIKHLSQPNNHFQNQPNLKNKKKLNSCSPVSQEPTSHKKNKKSKKSKLSQLRIQKLPMNMHKFRAKNSINRKRQKKQKNKSLRVNRNRLKQSLLSRKTNRVQVSLQKNNKKNKKANKRNQLQSKLKPKKLTSSLQNKFTYKILKPAK